MTKTVGLSEESWHLWGQWMDAHRLLVDALSKHLNHEFAISKAEFSLLLALRQSALPEVPVAQLVAALRWEKSRVSHLLTRMEARGLVHRALEGGSGRRLGMQLTPDGREIIDAAVIAHGHNIQRLFFDRLTPQQAVALHSWSEQVVKVHGDSDA